MSYRVFQKTLDQNEINITNTSNKNIKIKYAYSDRHNCFLSLTAHTYRTVNDQEFTHLAGLSLCVPCAENDDNII